MKKTILAMLVSAPILASAGTIKTEIAAAEELNTKCRGGSGDNPATEKICADRDRAYGNLRKRGWCYGHDGQAGYERKWGRCNASSEKVALYLPDGGKDRNVYRIDSITLVAYPERPCHLTELPHYKNMRLATMSRSPVCYFKRDGEVIILSPTQEPQRYPESFFAIASYNEADKTVTVNHPGFDSKKSGDEFIKAERAKTARLLPGAALPPRDRTN